MHISHAIALALSVFIAFMVLVFIYALSIHDKALCLFSIQYASGAVLTLLPNLYYIRYQESKRKYFIKR